MTGEDDLNEYQDFVDWHKKNGTAKEKISELWKIHQIYKLKRKVEKKFKQHTYIVYDKSSRLYKIGFSYNPKERVRALKTANPKVVLFATKKGNIEKEFHFLFKRRRVHGEWFKFKKDEINLIIECCGFLLE